MKSVDPGLHLDALAYWTPEDAKRFMEGNWVPKDEPIDARVSVDGGNPVPGEHVTTFLHAYRCCACGASGSVELTVYQTPSLRRSEAYCAKHLPQILVIVE